MATVFGCIYKKNLKSCLTTLTTYVIVINLALILLFTCEPLQRSLIHLINSAHAHQHSTSMRNNAWLATYNQTELKSDLQRTFEAYASRPDRAEKHLNTMLSRESTMHIANSTIFFQSHFVSAKLGPQTSLYWQSRLFSFFSTFYQFRFKDLDSIVDKIAKKQQRIWFNSKQYFSFLPKQSGIHAMDIDPDTYAKYADWVLHWISESKKKKMFGLYVYTHDHMDLMLSKVFLQIMRHETSVAFNAYFRANHMERQQNKIKNEMWVSKTDDILVHIRCQDVLLKSYGGAYGMSSLHYFNNAIKNVFEITLHKNMAIHIILYLGNIAGRPCIDAVCAKNTKACSMYLYDYLEPALSETFAPAQIKLITKGTVNNDFYRFISAPNIICGASSYCLMGAIANGNGNIVLFKQWTPGQWYQKGYNSFGPIADNIHFLNDPYFTPYNGQNVSQTAYQAMAINGTYVL